jgi:ribonuclease HII
MGPTLDYETEYWQAGHHYIVGLDEVGRGALAGSVVAGAVLLPVGDRVLCNVLRTAGLRDSKKLSARRREGLDGLIREVALAVAVGEADAGEIDAHGIVPALRLAMVRALEALPCKATVLLVDGPKFAPLFSKASTEGRGKGEEGQVLPVQRHIVRGDDASLSIAAAAVVAKVYRDKLMVEFDEVFPGYGFASHKGYGAKAHQSALQRLGPTPIHRMTWKPLRQLSYQQLQFELG